MTQKQRALTALGTAAMALACTGSAQAATTTEGVSGTNPNGTLSAHVFQAGQAVQITATGTWNGSPSDSNGPEGKVGNGNGLRVPNGTIYQLIGSTDGGATWFQVGAGPTRITTSGSLRLAMNDVPANFGDNGGSVSVTIADITSVSAPQTVSAVVAPDLSIAVAPTLSLGTLVPSLTNQNNQNTASTAVTVTSTAANADVSVSDPSTGANKGKLVNTTVGPSGTNESYALANALEVAGPSGVFAPLTSSVLVYSDPLSASNTAGEYSETTNVSFKQKVNANEGLRTGTYSKALTFTAETTTP